VSEQKCVMNTILALLGSTVATFAVSLALGKNKLDAVHIANSTLAGGVAVGVSARLDMGGGALLLGVLAGAISVAGYFYVSDTLDLWFGISDTCGVHNLHGLPALLGGLASAIFVVIDKDAEFLAYDAHHQAWRQIAATAATVALASVSGYLTGFILKENDRTSNWYPEYDDSVLWWEGEFYENVNTAGDEGHVGENESTHHGVSLSHHSIGKSSHHDPYAHYKPRAPHILIDVETPAPAAEVGKENDKTNDDVVEAGA